MHARCRESVVDVMALMATHVCGVTGHWNMGLRTLIDVIIGGISFDDHSPDCEWKFVSENQIRFSVTRVLDSFGTV